MKRLNKKCFAIVALAMAIIIVIGIFIIVITRLNTEEWKSNRALQQANDALELMISSQKDGELKSGTVIKVKTRVFVYEGNELTVASEAPDTSAAITLATIDKSGAIVYLLPGDGEPPAYRSSADVIYEKLIDPDSDLIDTYTYSQVNQPVQRYLDEVSYHGAADTVSEISKYLDPSGRYDNPAGCTIDLQAGELTIFDNGTSNAYTVTVEEGPYTFYNITPGVGGEFYVINHNKLVQQGHLRPTGTLRMIYTDTQGLQNIRDLGGWPCDGGTVKYNMIFRGGQVIDTTDTDRSTWVKLLGIDNDLFVKTYADSQFVGREEYRTKSPLGDNVTLYQMDLSAADNPDNKRNFQNAKEQMNGIINNLFDHAIAGNTTYFHCLAGADRTGMVAIIVEGVLGISKSDIDRDYELTSFSSLRERSNDGYIGDINILRSYPGETFRDKCVAYLMDCGITLEKINAFRKAMIDGEPEELKENKLDFEPEGTNLCVPDGEGWIDGGRCSSTGADRFDTPNFILTNYFPVQAGDVVYVKNLNISDTLYSGIYTADKTAITGFFMSSEGGVGFVKDITRPKDWVVFTVDNANAGYMRLCGLLTQTKEDVVIHIYREGEWLTIEQ